MYSSTSSPTALAGNKPYTPRRCDEFLLNDDIQKSVSFGEYLTRLRTLSCVLKDPGVNAFQSPGVEERASSQ